MLLIVPSAFSDISSKLTGTLKFQQLTNLMGKHFLMHFKTRFDKLSPTSLRVCFFSGLHSKVNHDDDVRSVTVLDVTGACEVTVQQTEQVPPDSSSVGSELENFSLRSSLNFTHSILL
ncbi:hypothetical protein ElyMa_001097700 [Elysia marginata]|uniref:Uncharacterized protein n=1 Tax=Elysia marginata TaxID=1093978 RepID=A0AAV4HTL2_9GAST|nr:hypothetical protein ElyMa_001097700 [Elysia marginata]